MVRRLEVLAMVALVLGGVLACKRFTKRSSGSPTSTSTYGGSSPDYAPDPAPTPTPAPTTPPSTASRTYKDPGGAFEVRFSGAFEVDTDTSSAGPGINVTTTTITAKRSDGAETAMKAAIGPISSYSCTAGLNGMRDKMLASAGCVATEEKFVTVATHQARRMRFSCAKDGLRGSAMLVCDTSDLAKKKEAAGIAFMMLADSKDKLADSKADTFLSNVTVRP
jgi:hypothetical protein